jgi:hypothetical protein
MSRLLGPRGEPTTLSSFIESRIGIYVALASAVAILAGSITVTPRTRSFGGSILRWRSRSRLPRKDGFGPTKASRGRGPSSQTRFSGTAESQIKPARRLP